MNGTPKRPMASELKDMSEQLSASLSEMIGSSHHWYMGHDLSYRLFLHKARWVFVYIKFKSRFFNPRIKWPLYRTIGKVQGWIGGW